MKRITALFAALVLTLALGVGALAEEDNIDDGWMEEQAKQAAQAAKATQAPLPTAAPLPTITPSNLCIWCNDPWCEGVYCDRNDSWRDPVPGEHAFWDIQSGELHTAASLFARNNIAFERDEWLSGGFYSSPGQDITMFGLPVTLSFVFSSGSPGWLSYAEISASADDAEDAIAIYETLMEAVGNQYGGPTGGYLASRYSGTENEYNYPMADGGPDYDAMRAMLEGEGLVKLCTYYNNIGVFMALEDAPHSSVWMRIYYNLPAGQEEFRVPKSTDFTSYTRPNGDYDAESKAIVIGF